MDESYITSRASLIVYRIKLKSTLCMLGNFSCFCCLLIFFQNLLLKKSFRNTIRVTNGLDPDQDRPYVGPDLGPNCLQSLSAEDKLQLAKYELTLKVPNMTAADDKFCDIFPNFQRKIRYNIS